MGDDASRPPRLRGHSEAPLAILLCGIALLLVVFDVAGAVANWLDGGNFAFVGPTPVAHFIEYVVEHPGHPAAGWPSMSNAPYPAIAFWPILGSLVLVVAVLGLWSWHMLHGRFNGPTEDGFATREGLEQLGTFGAAARLVPQTRPSLVQQKLVPRDVGYPLGHTIRPKGIELVASWEASMQIVAPPGAGKTMRVLAPILRQHPGPVLATSTKADLFEVSVAQRRRTGPVFALDPEALVPAAEPLRWSPVSGCEDTRVAERRASALIAANGEANDVRAGAFFRQSAVAVLGAYLHAAAISGGTIGDVVRWATRPSDPAPRHILANSGDDAVDWAARLHEHTTGAVETTSGVTRTVDLALACFRHREVLDLCSTQSDSAFDFMEVLASSGTVYALGKDRSGVTGGVGPLITAFCEELLLQAEQVASRKTGRRLDPPLLALLDEAPSIVPLPGLPGLVADGRGRGITVVYAMQSFSQAIERWGPGGAATMRNATTVTAVFGGLKVAQDLKELSDLCGTHKVLRHSANADSRNGRDAVSATWMDEPVLTQAEIASLSDGKLLVLWGRLPPVLAHLPGVWEGSDARAIADEERAARLANDAARNAGER